jgi:ribosome-associated protein
VKNAKSLSKPAAAAFEPAIAAKARAMPNTKPAAKVVAKPATKRAATATARTTGSAKAAPKSAVKSPPAKSAAKPAEPAKRAAARAAAGPPAETAPHSVGLPKRPRPARKVAASARLDMARRIVALAEDKKAADILLLDLDGLTTLADAFVICSGGSERQLESIADGIVRGMRAEGIRPIGTEGLPASHWILVDFGDVIVHIFTPPERDYYGLEKHWSEAKPVLRVQ